MKTKIITRIGLAIIGLILATNVAYAQQAPISLQEQYQNTLVQLISLLQSQVQDLLKQLQDLQNKQIVLGSEQAVIESKIDTIIQNTQPIPEPIFSAPTSQPLSFTCKVSNNIVVVLPLGGTGNYQYYFPQLKRSSQIKGCNASFSSDGSMQISDACFIDSATITSSQAQSVIVKSNTEMKLAQCM